MTTNCGGALVVDQDESSRNTVLDMLARAGFECRGLDRGEDLLVIARNEEPRLVFLEVGLPDVSGFELCRELREEFGEDIGIVLMSADPVDSHDRTAGLLFGADEYVTKPIDNSEVLARVRRLSARLGWNLLSIGLRTNGQATTSLTDREREVLMLLALGRPQTQIASDLSISEKTVSSHLQRVLQKLNVHSRAHAVAVAYQDGLMRSDSRRLAEVGHP